MIFLCGSSIRFAGCSGESLTRCFCLGQSATIGARDGDVWGVCRGMVAGRERRALTGIGRGCSLRSLWGMLALGLRGPVGPGFFGLEFEHVEAVHGGGAVLAGEVHEAGFCGVVDEVVE